MWRSPIGSPPLRAGGTRSERRDFSGLVAVRRKCLAGRLVEGDRRSNRHLPLRACPGRAGGAGRRLRSFDAPGNLVVIRNGA